MSGAGGSAEPMSGVEGGADVVVAQYPVYLVRNADPGGALYLLQSPLRPATRPYALEECDEVRFKAKQGRMELELPLDTRSETYDTSAAPSVRIKQLSLRGTPVALRQREHGTLAVATFQGGALHLSPLSGVVALRPSLAHLDAADEARREAERAAGRRGAPEEEEEAEEGAEGLARLTPLQVQVRRRETERQAEARLASHAYLRQQDEEEPWQALAPCGPEAGPAAAVLSRLRAAPAGRAGEPLPRADYLAALLPPRPSTTAAPAVSGADALDGGAGGDVAEAWLGIPRATLDALPLHERVGAIFASQQRQVLSFSKLERLAPVATTTEALLRAASAHAVLVQGVWAARSAAGAGDAATLRDALLLAFARAPSALLSGAKLASLRAEPRALAAALAPLAVPRPKEGDPGAYELREPRDDAFLAAHPQLVADQEARWAAVAAHLAAARLYGHGGGDAGAPAATLPPAALPAALATFVGARKLVSAAGARAWLRAAPAAGGCRAAAALDDAALATALGAGWVALAGRLVATATGDASADPVRRVVLQLLRDKAAEGGEAAAHPSVRKADVQRAAAAALRAELPAGVYTRVMAALCTHAHGAWVLQTGEDAAAGAAADADAGSDLPPGFAR